MRRREFVALMGGAAASWPLAGQTQQGERVRTLGVLMGYSQDDPEANARLAAFLQGLQEAGWEHGRNIQIAYRWAGANVDRYEPLAKELIELQADVILANTTPVTAALQRQTRTIPIVFVVVSDPVGAGFVATLPRPGANITGFINIEGSMSGKWLELLKDIAPQITRAAIMFNPSTAPGGGAYFFPAFEAAGRALGVKSLAMPVRSSAEIEDAITSFASDPGGGLVESTDSFMTVHRKIVISLAERHKLPVVYPLGFYANEGGLLGYGPNYHDLFYRSAAYVDRILKGEKPADLPVLTPTKYELVINLKTAKALGLTVSQPLLARADEVIE
jgi:putative ABC transport system substrate-binding protein